MSHYVQKIFFSFAAKIIKKLPFFKKNIPKLKVKKVECLAILRWNNHQSILPKCTRNSHPSLLFKKGKNKMKHVNIEIVAWLPRFFFKYCNTIDGIKPASCLEGVNTSNILLHSSPLYHTTFPSSLCLLDRMIFFLLNISPSR